MTALQEVLNKRPMFPPSILVMEDEPSVAKGLAMVLTDEGYVVDLATTGRDALDRLSHKEFDLLVADLRLPDIDGMEVIRHVKTQWPDTEVVVITGYASVPSAVNAMKLGSFDYLPKPFTEDEIKSVVDGALKVKKAPRPEKVARKAVKSKENKVIQKREVIRVLERTREDDVFWKALMQRGSEVLEGYELSAEAKAAIVTGDLRWIRKHIGRLSKKQLAFIHKRLEREAW